jgi:hypothetical protein
MGKHDDTIANDYVLRKPINKKLHSIVRASGGSGWNGSPKHGLHPREGAARFAYDEKGDLWSYGRMSLARWLDDGTLLVNGDEGPSLMTKAQQRALRDAIKRHDIEKVAIVPFSAIRAAALEPQFIRIVATTSDRHIEKNFPCRDKKCKAAGTPHTHPRLVHFLGETLFQANTTEWIQTKEGPRAKTRETYFVSGLDRNDDPQRRNFYLARLPPCSKANAPKSVEAALERLRPGDVPSDALRQGEWFLLPDSQKKFKSEQILRNMKQVTPHANEDYLTGVPIVSADPKDQLERMRNGGWRMYSRRDRHRATRMVCNGSVYVSGMLRDAEHGLIKLGDGKTWFKVVRNTAVGSWRAGGDVD